MTDPQTDRFGQPGIIYITDSALRTIQEEARRHVGTGRIENETGGILVGRRIGVASSSAMLIVAATGPGDRAYHHPIEFNYDVDYSNRQLQEYRAIYPRADYVGTWHKHPPDYDTFSPQDLEQAYAIFSDPSYRLQEIINPIVWIKGGRFVIHYYYMSRAMAQGGRRFVTIAPEAICTIGDQHARVLQEKEPPNLLPLIPARINEEHRRLREKNYDVQVGEEAQSYYFKIRDAQRPKIVIYVMAWPGYPQTPPLLAVESNGRKIDVNSDALINQWLARHNDIYIAELADTLIEQIASSQLDVVDTLPYRRVGPHQDNSIGGKSTQQAGDASAQPKEHRSTPLRLIALMRMPSVLSPLIVVILAVVVFIAFKSISSVTGPTLVFTAAVGTVAKTIPIPTLTAIRVTVAPQELSRRWEEVQTAVAFPDRQVDLLTKLLADGIVRDPQGQSTSLRLQAARVEYIQQLLRDKKFAEARDVGEQALRDAPDSDTRKQMADLLAEVYLTGGKTAFDAGNLSDAKAAFESVASIRPAPPQDRLDRARQLIVAVEQASGERQRQDAIAQLWLDYDQATTVCQDKIKAVDAISATITLTPRMSDYPIESYDQRTQHIADIWSQTYVQCAQILQMQGLFDQARARYHDVQGTTAAPATWQNLATGDLARLKQAENLWARVNSPSVSREALLLALNELLGLAGFGPRAQNPRGGRTVADLIVRVPLATAIPTPSETPLPPSETPLPTG